MRRGVVYILTYYLVLSVYLLQLLGHLKSSVWTVVVNDDDLVVITTVLDNVKLPFS